MTISRILHPIFNEEMPRARLAALLEHFSQIDDDREPWRVVYPLAEILLLGRAIKRGTGIGV
jgi:hypothetical protein